MVRVRFADNVVGVNVAVKEPVPPARPTIATPSCVAAARVKTPDALVEVTEVNAPVLGVVAPTVPLMLMLAVPVRFVTVPLDGVPKAPPLTTNAPAVPVFTPKAVTTPVPVVMVEGAAPAPPPTTKALAASAADVAQVDALEKYGMPPLVPATLRARVPLVVIGEPETEIKPPVNDCATDVTVPPVPVADNVPPAKLTPEPMVTLLKPPAPLPYKMLEPLVAGA